MNATSLYVTTSRLVFQSDYTSKTSSKINEQNLMDLYRLVPYLRQSLSCTVCGGLLIQPHTPIDGNCQHHVCKLCIKGKKNLKPTCNWCKDYDKYEENMTLRILLQCYKSLCEHIINNTQIYNIICKQTTKASSGNSNSNNNNNNNNNGILNNGNINNVPRISLIEFIEEGAKFQDVFKSNSGLTKSSYSILPCLFNPLPLTQQQQQQITTITSSSSSSSSSTPPSLSTIVPTKNNVNNILNSSQHSMQHPQPQQQLQQHQQLQLHQLQQHHQTQQIHHHQQQQQQNKQQSQQQNIHHQQKQKQTTPVTTNNVIISSASNDLQQQQQQLHLSLQKTTTTTTTTAQHINHLPPIKTVSNGSAMYSVLYTGIGNKITIKRKTNGDDDFNNRKFQQQYIVRPPTASSSSTTTTTTSSSSSTTTATITKPLSSKRRGCRCGNATATPGKLTCCGQRCPCYVDQKSCIDCKCRGCRNPHRPDGGKIRPHIPELACYEIQLADDNSTTTTSLTSALNSTNSNSNNSTSGIGVGVGSGSSGNTRTITATSIPLIEDFTGNHHHISRLTPTKSIITNINTSSSSSFDGSNSGNSHLQQIRQHQQQQQQQQQHPQPLTFENIARESLLISSPEGNFQVLNVFTSQNHHTIGHHNSQLHTSGNRNNNNHHNNHQHQHHHQHHHHHQIPEISTTLPQIILQKQEPVSLSPPPLLSVASSSTTTSTLRPTTITTTTISSGNNRNNTNSNIISGSIGVGGINCNNGLTINSNTPMITLSPIIVNNNSSNPFPTQIFNEEEIITTQCSSLSPTQPPPLIEITSNEHNSSI